MLLKCFKFFYIKDNLFIYYTIFIKRLSNKTITLSAVILSIKVKVAIRVKNKKKKNNDESLKVSRK